MYIYQIEVRHKGLNKYRLIRGKSEYDVQQRAEMQKKIWDEMWERKVERESSAKNKEEKKQLAQEKTLEAQTKIKEIENVLQQTLSVNDAINWESLLRKQEYPIQSPQKQNLLSVPLEPKKDEIKFSPLINLVDSLLPSLMLRKRRIVAIEDKFRLELSKWEKEKLSIEQRNREAIKTYDEELSKWQEEKERYYKEQKDWNDKILAQKEDYFKGDKNAFINYCDMVLENSKYPDNFPQEYEFHYNPETKIFLIDYFLPSKDDIPTLKEVKYTASTDEFKELYFSEPIINKLYDNILYQVTLRTIHELYEADVINLISSIIFNGWVKFVDKANGQQVTACILSIQAERNEFLSINLESIEPKTCFKRLKGIGSSQLYGLTPIAPIMQINKEDKRFVTPYEVINSVNEQTNIAAMDWKDFENLIREIFEKEFSSVGGEVKITQASRDGGVDAVAFDPDPIRGGKIIIQAKRYTNVVGLSAVRDLYGTIMNEGATKGILITTADYGSDAYNFAKNKPITLLNGNNLLHLLRKHNYKAKIDIQEAKKILNQQEG